MSRLRVLVSQPRHALGALLTLLLAAGAVVGSGADFTASSASANNTFTSGTLSMDNSKDGAVILSASNLRPGGAAAPGVVDIENTGSLSGEFTLKRLSPVDSDADNPMSEKLNIEVVDCGAYAGATVPTCDAGDSAVYDGTLADMDTADLDEYAAAEKHRYQFSVELDQSADNEYQGDSSSVAFEFNAAS
jgi:hypothetical protein